MRDSDSVRIATAAAPPMAPPTMTLVVDDVDELHDDAGRRVCAGVRERQGEEDDRRAIVQQALALDDHLKTPRRLERAEERHDRDGIGGRNERGEHHRARAIGNQIRRNAERLEGRPQCECGEHDRRDDAGHGKRRERDAVVAHFLDFQIERGLEDQRGQHHAEHDLARQRRCDE